MRDMSVGWSTPLTPSRPWKTTGDAVTLLTTSRTAASAADRRSAASTTSAGTVTVWEVLSQSSRTSVLSTAGSTVCPGTSSVMSGRPSGPMDSAASDGSRWSSPPTRSRVRLSGASVMRLTMPTSRFSKKLRTRVTGLSGCRPAWSTVRPQSTLRPDGAGSMTEDMFPATTVTGSRSLPSRLLRSRCSACSWSSPPMSTPPTVTPRGTCPSDMK